MNTTDHPQRDVRLPPPEPAENRPTPQGVPDESCEYSWRVAARERQLQRERMTRWTQNSLQKRS